jgi:hypothetical protein
MTRIDWDDKPFEVGVDRGVFYPTANPGVAWNGLKSVTEKAPGVESRIRFFDGDQYQNLYLEDSFSATVEAYTYPSEFEEYDGLVDDFIANQRRKSFGLSYRTTVGMDVGYKIHLVYNALASPANRNFSSLNPNTDPADFVWDIATTPINIPGGFPSAHLIIDTTTAYNWTVEALEDLIYGDDTGDPTLPSPADVLEVFESNAILRITDHGDGTWTATGPDAAIQMVSATEFEITWPSAVYLDSETYQISSL